jgi:acetate---CoA ligase (ADP-forming)
MINRQLTHPQSIVVVGGSNDIQKPGGKILKNLIDGKFKGELFVINPKEDEVQGIRSYKDPAEMPEADLAIIAIAAKYTPSIVEFLTLKKNTRAFIIISAGYSEESEEGKKLEAEIVRLVNKVNGSLIGPNCIGVITPQHHSVFTLPIPKLDPKGCDFISGSGATACFIMEAGITKGLRFANVYSVGNSAQMGVEDILKHMDENFDSELDSKVKMLYLETVEKPELLLKHASSLIQKGCRIAAIKAGTSEAGSRAATSHTGALASPDMAVDALFRKAGIVRCKGREELISVASVFQYPELHGKRIAVITHAGGPAVMITDALSEGGLEIPEIKGADAEELKEKLFPGSSVSNPIDFLATGNAEQLGTIIDYVNEKFIHIDAMIVIFGTPGLTDIFDVYKVLNQKIDQSPKPIYPVMPSVITAKAEMDEFISTGKVFFTDEVNLATALTKSFNTVKHEINQENLPLVDKVKVQSVVKNTKGYLTPDQVGQLLDLAGIPRVQEIVVSKIEDLKSATIKIGFPLVMKVVGPVHKSDVGGVILNVNSIERARGEFMRMMKIKNTKGVLLQPMMNGTELFAGVKREGKFGHLILFGLGGIFIEALKDTRVVLAPAERQEVLDEIVKLKGYKIIKGLRGKEPVDEELFADIVVRLGALAEAVPEISELDLNPLLGRGNQVLAVDARIKIS